MVPTVFTEGTGGESSERNMGGDSSDQGTLGCLAKGDSSDQGTLGCLPKADSSDQGTLGCLAKGDSLCKTTPG